MKRTAEAIVFPCLGERLVGVLERPETPALVGVVIVVGGPQYRAGSHRQFVALARGLADQGFPVLRFDYRGMGDSSGVPTPFDSTAEDIGAAVSELRSRCPSVNKVVLWGLCDGASAALLYQAAGGGARIGGLCLLNPWVRSEATLARTQVKHYYGQRLLEPEFWRKFLRGDIKVVASVRELLAKLRLSTSNAPVADSAQPFQTRMAGALRAFKGPVLVILSGHDYTAKEFLEYAGSDPAWAGVLASAGIVRRELPDADHTFSSAILRAQCEQATLQWLREIEAAA